jgi:hypothetical protein
MHACTHARVYIRLGVLFPGRSILLRRWERIFLACAANGDCLEASRGSMNKKDGVGIGWYLWGQVVKLETLVEGIRIRVRLLGVETW